MKWDGYYTVLISSTVILFIELQSTQGIYEMKLKNGQTAEQTMFSLTWDINELTHLVAEYRQLHVDLATALDIVSSPNTMQQHLNLPRKLGSIRKKRVELIKSITRFKRKPATHIFVFMISSELRDKKPYALPVQCFPYAG